MRKLVSRITIAILALVLFNGCSTELDIAADYKEIPVIVGMLNKSDSVQYFKVNRAYLNTEGNAIVVGNVSDSNLYPYPITVKLFWYRNDLTAANLVDSVTLDTAIIVKDPGNFNNNNVLYKTPPGFRIRYNNIASSTDTNWYIYEIVVRRTSDQKLIAKSNARIVEDTRLISAGSAVNLAIQKPDPAEPVEYLNTTVLRWSKPQWAKQYNGYMTFRFREVDDATGEVVEKALTRQIFFNNLFDNPSIVQGEFSYNIAGREFYEWIQANLDPLSSASARREYIAPLEFTLEFAGEALSQYYQINNNNVSLSDVSPEYTNIEGGYGVFSSRYKRIVKDAVRTGLSQPSITELKNGAITGRAAGANDLGFR